MLRNSQNCSPSLRYPSTLQQENGLFFLSVILRAKQGLFGGGGGVLVIVEQPSKMRLQQQVNCNFFIPLQHQISSQKKKGACQLLREPPARKPTPHLAVSNINAFTFHMLSSFKPPFWNSENINLKKQTRTTLGFNEQFQPQTKNGSVNKCKKRGLKFTGRQKGDFGERTLVPFFVPGKHPNVPSFQFRSRGTSAKTTLLENHPLSFVNPR